MSQGNRAPKEVKFWTPLRLMSTVIVLALVAAFGVSSCNSNDPPSTSTAPKVEVKKGTAPNAVRPNVPRLVLYLFMKTHYQKRLNIVVPSSADALTVCR